MFQLWVYRSHRASQCSSKASCQKCGKRHHTPICYAPKVKVEPALTTNQASEGVLPIKIVIIRINGIKCRALIDSGSGSSYISAKLIDMLKVKPDSTQTRQVEVLMSSKTVRMDIYLPVNFIKVNKAELLYADLVRDNARLSDVKVADSDKRLSFQYMIFLEVVSTRVLKQKPNHKLERKARLLWS